MYREYTKPSQLNIDGEPIRQSEYIPQSVVHINLSPLHVVRVVLNKPEPKMNCWQISSYEKPVGFPCTSPSRVTKPLSDGRYPVPKRQSLRLPLVNITGPIKGSVNPIA